MSASCRLAAGRTLRLVGAGPLVVIGFAACHAAQVVDGICRLIEGGGPPAAKAADAIAPREVEPAAADLAVYRAACLVLWRGGFDTTAIAELLLEHEADVARWLFQAREALAQAPKVAHG